MLWRLRDQHGFCLGLAEGIWDQETQELSVWGHVSGEEKDICAQTHTCFCLCVCMLQKWLERRVEETVVTWRQWEISKGIPARSDMVRLSWLLSEDSCLSFCYYSHFLTSALLHFKIPHSPLTSWFLPFLSIYLQAPIISPASLNPMMCHQNNSPANILVLLLPCATSKLQHCMWGSVQPFFFLICRWLSPGGRVPPPMVWCYCKFMVFEINWAFTMTVKAKMALH